MQYDVLHKCLIAQEAQDDAQQMSVSHAVLTQIFHSSDHIIEKLQDLLLMALLCDLSIVILML